MGAPDISSPPKKMSFYYTFGKSNNKRNGNMNTNYYNWLSRGCWNIITFSSCLIYCRWFTQNLAGSLCHSAILTLNMTMIYRKLFEAVFMLLRFPTDFRWILLDILLGPLSLTYTHANTHTHCQLFSFIGKVQNKNVYWSSTIPSHMQ